MHRDTHRGDTASATSIGVGAGGGVRVGRGEGVGHLQTRRQRPRPVARLGLLRAATAGLMAARLAATGRAAVGLTAAGLVAVALVAVGLAAAGQQAQAAVPPVAPLPSQVQPVPLPPITRATLANGLEVVVAQRHQRPLVALRLTIPAGHQLDPPELPGLAGFVADMLKQGTARRSAEEIARALEATGGQLTVSAGADATVVSGQWLSKDLGPALELVGEMVTSPTFPQSEMAILRPRWQASVRRQFDDPAELAALHANHLLYGSTHPLGYFPDEARMGAVRREDLVAFHRAYYTARGAQLVVVGDVDPDRVLELARRHLGSWPSTAAPSRTPAPVRLESSRVRFVRWPGQTQVRVELRQPGPAATVDDWLAVRLYNYVLAGGGFASRLMEVVRARLGSTYDIHSYYQAYRFPAHWVLSTYTRNDQLWATLQVLQAELARFYRQGITARELEEARSFYIFSYPLRLETAADLAYALSDALWHGRGLDWVARFPVLVSQLTLQEVNAAIRRHFDPDRVAVTLLGDPEVLRTAPPAIWGVPLERVEQVDRTEVPRR